MSSGSAGWRFSPCQSRDRAKYGGWFVAVYAVASVVGPVTGGAPITLSMQNALPQADLRVATSSNTFFRQIGATAGTAVFLSITYSAAGRAITRAYASAAPSMRAVAARYPGQAAALRLASSGSQSALNTAFLTRLDPVLAQPFRQGFASALDLAFLASAVVMAAALVLALLIRELPLRTTVAAQPAAAAEPAARRP
jgi:hypothetical protein